MALVDLASERLGGVVIAANDDFFAPKENLIKIEAPISVEGKFTNHGKWMDGWETRRRREPGHDWCIVRLGARGLIKGIDVDTSFFRGNFPEACAMDACSLDGSRGIAELEQATWREILQPTRLDGDMHNRLDVRTSETANHVRLRIFPDGGVARLRVYGEVVPDWNRLAAEGPVDLAGVLSGGVVVMASDMFFGSRQNLIMPGEARNMSEGWETRRRRGPGNDWTVIRLGTPGVIERALVSTSHFKGNAPAACSIDACLDSDWQAAEWRELLPRTPLQPDAEQAFTETIQPIGPVRHVRFNIFPDGGVARLRLFGTVEPSLRQES